MCNKSRLPFPTYLRRTYIRISSSLIYSVSLALLLVVLLPPVAVHHDVASWLAVNFIEKFPIGLPGAYAPIWSVDRSFLLILTYFGLHVSPSGGKRLQSRRFSVTPGCSKLPVRSSFAQPTIQGTHPCIILIAERLFISLTP
jgi:hypothetical protein